jgi:acetyl esterase/lipase
VRPYALVENAKVDRGHRAIIAQTGTAAPGFACAANTLAATRRQDGNDGCDHVPLPCAFGKRAMPLESPTRSAPMSDSEIDAIRALLSSKPRPVGWPARRARLDEIGTVDPVAPDVTLETVRIGTLEAEWSTVPGSDPRRVLLFFHGGGYCSGSIASHRRMVTEAGRAAGVRTLAVGYRLAPEHPFPAAIGDAIEAWRFLRGKGFAPEHIAVGGDSAGGGLTAVLINDLRSVGAAPPACAWLVSPWTDLTMSGGTLASKDGVDPIIHGGYLHELADAFVADGHDRRDPRVSPLYANLAGFPPTLIQVGGDETLLSDATRFAEAAGAAEVAVTLEIWPRMIHAWPLWNARLEPGRSALDHAGAFIRSAMDAASRSG